MPTTACATRCDYCFYETGHSPRVEATRWLQPLDGALDDLVQRGLHQVIISGGEPLLAPTLLELVELCASKLVHILLLTKGEGLDDARLAELERAGVDDITLGAQAADDSLRALVRRVLFHSRYLPCLLTCLTRRNLAEVPRLLELSTQLQLPQIFTPAYIPRAAPAGEALSLRGLDEATWEALLASLGDWAVQADARDYLELVRLCYRGAPVRPQSCDMGTSALVVDADGAVYPCFHRRDLRAGNLLHDPWPEIARRLALGGEVLHAAPCFGEHCLSLFVGARAGRAPTRPT